MRIAAIAAILLSFIAPGAAIAAPGQRVEIPIREVDLSDGARRYTISITIDGQTIDVGVDTGSTGLRVLARAIPGAADVKGAPSDYFYSSGTRFKGSAIERTLAIGGLSGEVKVQRIDKIGCTNAQPDCPARDADLATFGIQGDGLAGQGFPAIIGIGMKIDSVANPFEQLGAKRWIVELPTPGNPRSGRLVLNPTDGEMAAYRRLALVDDGNNLAGCLVGPAALGKICGLTLFDSGAPGIRITTAKDMQPWPQGTLAQIAIGDGKAMATMQVAIGRRDQASGMIIVRRPVATDTRISLGLAPYFHWSVLYDAAARQIGLLDR